MKALRLLTAVLAASICTCAWGQKAPVAERWDDYVQYVPAFADLTMGAIGIKSEHRFLDRTLTLGVAYVSEAIIVNSLKYTIREERPDGSARNSFPSGHTATIFTGAELVRMEYGWGYGAVAYGLAAGVGSMRVYREKHWPWDVAAGATIGILCAHIGDWMLPYTRSAWDSCFHRSRAELTVAPSFDYMTGAVGTTLALRF